MKHISCLLFLFFIFSINSPGQKTETWTDLKKMNVTGAVSSLKEISYTSKDGFNKIESTHVDSTLPNCSYYFNRYGNIDSIANYSREGKISVMELFSYNDKGFLDQKKEIDTNRKLISTENIQYDNSNYKTKEIYKNHIGEIIQQEIYKYNISDSNNYSYSMTGLGRNNTIVTEVIYSLKYSVNNNLLYKITEYPLVKGTAMKGKFYYDSANQVVHKTVETMTRKKIESEQFMEYDKKGNITKFRETLPRNYIEYSYEYDNPHNWTKRTTKAFVPDKNTGKMVSLYTITLRAYKYY